MVIQVSVDKNCLLALQVSNIGTNRFSSHYHHKKYKKISKYAEISTWIASSYFSFKNMRNFRAFLQTAYKAYSFCLKL